MIKNLHLITLLCGALITLQGCITPQNVEEPESEKGQFKVVLTNDIGRTRGFWETDPAKLKSGEPCEQELHSVTILVYNQARTPNDQPVYIRDFSTAELARKSSIFSLPSSTTSADQNSKVAFYAFANYKVATTINEVALYKQTLGPICEYFNLAVPTSNPDTLNTEFSSIYPNGPTAPAVALRDVASGKGFVMSSVEPVIIQMSPTDDPNKPRTVNLELARAVSRIEIKAHTTPAFTAKYPGSKLVIDSISISNMPKSSVISLCETPPAVIDFLVMTQRPITTTVGDITHNNFIFYCYENTQTEGAQPSRRPKLDIIATFDFDGNLSTTEDATTIKYSKELEMSGNGSILRNTLYQVKVMLNGLTEREVISSIEILPWNTVSEDVSFGG